jgi:hypothetical protein
MPKTLTLREKRLKARKLGIVDSRSLDEDELDEALVKAERKASKNGTSTKGKAKKAVSKAVSKKRASRDDDDEDDDEDDEKPRRRGRPKGSTNKKGTATAKRGPGRPKGSGTKTKTSVKAITKRSGKLGRPKGTGTGTRVLVPDEIDWDFDFSFRDGSTSQYILNELKKAAQKRTDTADIRARVLERLEPKIGQVDELVFMDRLTGKRKKGADAQKMLIYRINRTILDFCINTDQHEGATAKPATKKSSSAKGSKGGATVKRGRPRKNRDDDDDDEAPKKKRGRPKGSKNRVPASEKPRKGPGRPKGSKNTPKSEKPRRGRPKGSKNKR